MNQKRGYSKKKSLKSCLDEEIKELRSQYRTILCGKDVIKRFQDFPLSQKTLKGLADARFMQPTDIQRDSIGPALQGKDVLGVAITGSGKTLAFLIPLLEHLYVGKWSRTDGVAAIIISPTRELAYQIFETLKNIGKYHDFSAGLIIGGKNLKFERSRMDRCNILICTPGRLLQHMDENPLFTASTMEMLVLDEADRCLDMGFEQTLNAIIENFPPDRQTLLFSATQTHFIKDLVRLNLKDPVYIGQPHSGDLVKSNPRVVPDLLQQNYVVIELEDKITMIWSFIKNHLKQKIIIFLSSCKQVKYIYEIFCKLRPRTGLLALYGTLHQDRRIAIYNDFVKKNNAVLFATDVASRGLDFPSVNWVVQLDCPEDVTQYIHRAGRSARNNSRGECLLVLMPSEEEGMIEELSRKFISIRKIQIDPRKLFSPRGKIEAFLAQNPELKSSAQRAFVAYVKSVFLMKNKKIFNILALNFDAYAKSLGLIVTPRVRFLERYLKKKIDKSDNKSDQSNCNSEDSENGNNQDKQKKVSKQTKHEKDDCVLFKNCESNSESDDDEFIKIKRTNHEIVDIQENKSSGFDIDDNNLVPLAFRKKERLITKTALIKKALKKKLQLNEKVKFDEEGNEIINQRKQLQSELAKEYESKNLSPGGIDIEVVKQLLQEEDKFDKQRFRQLVKKKHKVIKEKLKNRDQNKEQVDEIYNSDDSVDDSEDEDGSVDLSLLPDPCKVDSIQSIPNKDLNADKDTSIKVRKRRQDGNDSSGEDGNYCAKSHSKRSKVTSKLTLSDAEIIAVQLLANSK